jgi:hypothetical protein
MNCAICHEEFQDNERVIFSSRETFIFKPAGIPDIVNPANVSTDELRDSRKEHLKTAVVNTFCDWGKAQIPENAFHFRHQGCEPQRTGASNSLHPVNKHSIRFRSAKAKRFNG